VFIAATTTVRRSAHAESPDPTHGFVQPRIVILDAFDRRQSAD
jgi:hypothetical protein